MEPLSMGPLVKFTAMGRSDLVGSRAYKPWCEPAVVGRGELVGCRALVDLTKAV